MTREIEKALMAAWADFPTVEKDKTNEFAKFNYASLTKITEAIKPALVKNGLRVSYDHKNPTDSMDQVAVKARVTHAESGEFIESDWLSAKVRNKKQGAEPTPQCLMAMITYLKRYTVVGLLGIVTDDPDLDDQDPNQQSSPKQQRQAQPTPTPAPVDTQEQARQECLKVLRGYMVSHGESRIKHILNLTDLSKLRKLDLRSLNSARNIIEKALASTSEPTTENMVEEPLHA